MTGTAIILIGISGSGKTTHAKSAVTEVQASYFGRSHVKMCFAQAYLPELPLYGEFEQPENQHYMMASKYCRENFRAFNAYSDEVRWYRMAQAAKRGGIIVIDTLNLKRNERAAHVLDAHRMGMKAMGVFLNVHPHACALRIRKLRGRCIDSRPFFEQARALERPKAEEFDEYMVIE